MLPMLIVLITRKRLPNGLTQKAQPHPIYPTSEYGIFLKILLRNSLHLFMTFSRGHLQTYWISTFLKRVRFDPFDM